VHGLTCDMRAIEPWMDGWLELQQKLEVVFSAEMMFDKCLCLVSFMLLIVSTVSISGW